MNPVTRRLTMAHIKASGYTRGLADRMRNDDRGQGTLEYVGIVIAILAILALIIGVVKGYNLDQKLKTQMDEIFN